MQNLQWNPEKNSILKERRAICFEDIQVAIQEGNLLETIDHQNSTTYPNQFILIVKVQEYVYSVPCIVEETGLFLKTIYPSRKLTKQYIS